MDAWRQEQVGWVTWQILLGLAEAGLMYFDGFFTVMSWNERELRMWPIPCRSKRA